MLKKNNIYNAFHFFPLDTRWNFLHKLLHFKTKHNTDKLCNLFTSTYIYINKLITFSVNIPFFSTCYLKIAVFYHFLYFCFLGVTDYFIFIHQFTRIISQEDEKNSFLRIFLFCILNTLYFYFFEYLLHILIDEVFYISYTSKYNRTLLHFVFLIVYIMRVTYL